MCSNIVGLDWSTFFDVKEDVKELKKSLESQHEVVDGFYHSSILNNLEKYKGIRNIVAKVDKSELYNLVNKLIINLAINLTDFAKCILDEESYEKAVATYNRKQYNSKILKTISYKVYCIYRYFDYDDSELSKRVDKISNTILSDFNKGLSEILDNKVMKEYAPLVNVIKNITSGISNSLYLEKRSLYYYNDFNSDVVNHILEHYNYDIAKAYSKNIFSRIGTLNSFIDKNESLSRILKFSLLNDKEFWNNHNEFNLISLINDVCKANSLKHAIKIVDYIFNNIIKDDFYVFLIKNNLPLFDVSKEDIIEYIKDHCLNHNIGRFIDNTIINEAVKSLDILAYPLCDNEDAIKIINIGKEYFSKFLCIIYPNESKKVLDIISEDSNLIFYSYINNMFGIMTRKDIRFTENIEEAIVNYFCKGFTSKENALNRLYILCYMFNEFSQEKNYEYLFELLFEVFDDIYKRHGISTSLQLALSVREDNFNRLVELLFEYGFDISNSNLKTEYIISLLDRKVALTCEREKFAELEQFGDAIYDLAVCELLVFNPYIKGMDKREDLIKANAQVLISKKIGLDKLYIDSKIKVNNKSKIDIFDEDYYLNQDDSKCDEKYIADSLEMLIAVIAKDFGIKKALSFAKKIISKYDSSLGYELHISSGYEIAKMQQDKEIDYEFFSLINPTTFTTEHNYYNNHSCYDMLGSALNKVISCIIYGNDTVEKRKEITYKCQNFLMKFEDKNFYMDTDITPQLYDYFHFGLEFVIDNYKDMVIDYFSKNK